MDTIEITPRKRSTVIRANQEQAKILKNAFATSEMYDIQRIKALSEETGLPHKWIISWFFRQRKKIRKDPGADAVLSLGQAIDYKTEYRDPPVHKTPLKQHLVPPAKKLGRPPKIKVKSENPDEEIALEPKSLEPLQQPPAQVPQSQPLPVTASRSQTVNDAPQPSKLILRPIAPRMYKVPDYPLMPILPETRPNSMNNTRPCSHFLNLSYSDSIPNRGPEYLSLRSIAQPEPYTIMHDHPRLPFQIPLQPTTRINSQDQHFTHSLDFSRYPIQPLHGLLSPLDMHESSTHFILLDSSKTPLKHLTLLQPLLTDINERHTTVNKEDVIEQLLDDRLVEEDPFQATMGLVFLSQLGLEWEFR